jgi:hypothetical protein
VELHYTATREHTFSAFLCFLAAFVVVIVVFIVDFYYLSCEYGTTPVNVAVDNLDAVIQVAMEQASLTQSQNSHIGVLFS